MRAGIPQPLRVCGLLWPSRHNWHTDTCISSTAFIYLQTKSLDSFPQQFLRILVHAGQLLGDGVLRPVLLLRQALDPPDLGQELADLLVYVPAILLGHGYCGSVFFKALPFILLQNA